MISSAARRKSAEAVADRPLERHLADGEIEQVEAGRPGVAAEHDDPTAAPNRCERRSDGRRRACGLEHDLRVDLGGAVGRQGGRRARLGRELARPLGPAEGDDLSRPLQHRRLHDAQPERTDPDDRDPSAGYRHPVDGMECHRERLDEDRTLGLHLGAHRHARPPVGDQEVGHAAVGAHPERHHERAAVLVAGGALAAPAAWARRPRRDPRADGLPRGRARLDDDADHLVAERHRAPCGR